MDAAFIFRQGLGTAPPRQYPLAQQLHAPAHLPAYGGPRPQQQLYHQQHIQQQQQQQQQRHANNHDDLSDNDGSEGRVAHTLTACCRCRQRKTRCDPTLPRCLPCERSGSTCEYLDTAKGRKINRYYVIRLQDKVRALEAELAQFTDDDGDDPANREDMVRPGGMIRLNAPDETARYLGPSSGIAMSRLLADEAKRYTDSSRISEIIPEVRARRQARMQSIQMTGTGMPRKKSIYPVVSDRPAESLPTRTVVDKLVDVFMQKAQQFWPILHEKVFQQDLEAVYAGDSDPYKNFVVRMVIAISTQKLDITYAGLADSYYLAAMRHVEDILRPKDLKTLQCLVLIAQYSLLTPTRTPIYYVIGLAARICQQEGLTNEKTISAGYSLDPQIVDMRRRLVWIVSAMELGLAHSMGRPSAFATTNDYLDVNFFATVDDENVTEGGILSGPPSSRKLIAIHFYKLRICQAEIRRALYERKRPDPKDDNDPWYGRIEKRMKEWLDSCPDKSPWAKAWFNGRYHQMRIFMYRPSPQVPKPSPEAASVCFESAAFIINLSRKQMQSATEDITWVYLQTINMALNILIWATSYSMVRENHTREVVEDLVHNGLDVLEQSEERWPGSAAAAQLFAVLSKACLMSYEVNPRNDPQSAGPFASPPAISEPQSSPDMFQQSQNHQQAPFLNPPQFGQVFDSPPEPMSNFAFDPNVPPSHPTFRSNSIFRNPATSDAFGRRFSYFPPDSTQPGETAPHESAPIPPPSESAPPAMGSMPTPPESLGPSDISANVSTSTLSPPDAPASLVQPNISPNVRIALPPQGIAPITDKIAVPPPQMAPGQPAQRRMHNYTSAPQNIHQNIQQRPLPTVNNANDWFANTQPFMSPYNFAAINNTFYNDAYGSAALNNPGNAGLGLQNMAAVGVPGLNEQFEFQPGRQGSLTQSQQLELMNVLETEGVGDIEAILNANNNMGDVQWF